MIQTRRSRSLIFFFSLFCLLFSTVNCQAKNTLWQVRSGEHTLYLLGSLHVLKKNSYPLDPFIEKVYQASDTLIFETDLDEMDTPAMQQKILSYGRLPTGRTLAQQLSPATLERLKAKVADLQLPLAHFMQMKPWFCALTLTVLEFEKLGFLPEYGLDEYFYAMARKDKKTIIPLESVEFQLSLFFSQSNKEQEDFLNQTLTDLTLTDDLADELEKAWKTGDDKKLHGLIARSFTGYPKQYERLVLQRNRNWIPILEKKLKSNDLTLAIVGTGHLVGPGSVVDLLRKKGYKVVQR